MNWRMESSGASGTTLVTIELVEGRTEQSAARVRIRVTPTGGHDWPTAPVFPRGMVYRDRNGTDYTILGHGIEERGAPDGEASMWTHVYPALMGTHSLSNLQA